MDGITLTRTHGCGTKLIADHLYLVLRIAVGWNDVDGRRAERVCDLQLAYGISKPKDSEEASG